MCPKKRKEFSRARKQLNLVTHETINKGDLMDYDGTTFAVDYVDWTWLIDLHVRDDIGLQAHDILAHILWEITFHGFTNNKVKNSRETLENLCGSLSG